MSAAQDAGANSSSSDDNTPAPSTTANSTSGSAAHDDNLVCKWNHCNERFTTPETLYVRVLPPSKRSLMMSKC